MTKIEQKMLPEVYEGWNEHNPTVTSSTLFDYLGSNMRTRYDSVRFSEQLDLSYLTPSIRQLYDTTQMGHVFSTNDRERLLSAEVEVDSKDPKLQDIWNKFKENNANLANLQAPVERSRVAFYSPEDRNFQITKVKQGDFTSVQNDLITVIKEGNIPVLPMHTHPHDVLPSPQDYMCMILDVTNNSRSLANATLVLCPSSQILVIATPQTPLLEESEAVEMRDYWDRQIDEDPRRKAFLSERIHLMKQLNKNLVFYSDKMAKRDEEIHRRLELGRITEEEYHRLMKDAVKYYIARSQKRSKKIVRKSYRIQDRSDLYNEQSTNAVLMECARSMQVELFFSQNMKDFQRFSA